MNDYSDSVGNWPFEPDATFMEDSIGVNDLTNNGADQETSNYKVGNGAAAFIRANNDYAYRADGDLSDDFPFKNGQSNKDITFCAWVYANTVPTSGYTYHYFYFKYLALSLSVRHDGSKPVFKGESRYSDSYHYFSHSHTVKAGQWYFLGVTYDSSGNWRWRIWDDDESAWLTDATGTLDEADESSYAQFIGGDGGTNNWDGIIDDCTIWNKILTADEITLVKNGTYSQNILASAQSDIQISTTATAIVKRSISGSSNITISVTGNTVNTLPYTQDFSAGKPTSEDGWEYYSDTAEGRIEVVGERLRMDDTTDNDLYTLNEAILHLDLTNKADVILTLDHYTINDEITPITTNFTDHFKGDGIALSVDGINWVKVTNLTSSFTAQSYALDSIIEQAKTAAGSSDVSNVRIKFQQYDNYPANDDGREFDNISVIGKIVNTLPYTQDFSAGKPTIAQGWEYYSDTAEGRIQVTGGRLRMDDTTSNYLYTLNEAILHLDLTNKADVTLTLDHYTINDEITALPDNFTEHYNGDGIALSVDGINWIKVTNLTGSFTAQAFALDSIIEQAKIVAGSTDVSDVRIKFQQWDNYPANDDGREFDNISITGNADIGGIVSASGESVISISCSGAAIVKRNIAAQSNIQISVTGNADVQELEEAAAESNVNITCSGNAIVTRSVLGQSDITILTTANSICKRNISSQSDIVISVIGNASTTGEISASGESNINISVSGTAIVKRSISGSSNITISVTGNADIGGIVSASGESVISISCSGAAIVKRSVSAISNITIETIGLATRILHATGLSEINILTVANVVRNRYASGSSIIQIVTTISGKIIISASGRSDILITTASSAIATRHISGTSNVMVNVLGNAIGYWAAQAASNVTISVEGNAQTGAKVAWYIQANQTKLNSLMGIT